MRIFTIFLAHSTQSVTVRAEVYKTTMIDFPNPRGEPISVSAVEFLEEDTKSAQPVAVFFTEQIAGIVDVTDQI